jgi:hypothetical protein
MLVYLLVCLSQELGVYEAEGNLLMEVRFHPGEDVLSLQVVLHLLQYT